jgi:hypothetical protein
MGDGGLDEIVDQAPGVPSGQRAPLDDRYRKRADHGPGADAADQWYSRTAREPRMCLDHLGSWRRSFSAVGVAILIGVGVGMALVGFALVLDVLSLREILADYGPSLLWRLTLAARDRVEHDGAQWAELATGLAGLALVLLTLRHVAAPRRLAPVEAERLKRDHRAA